MNKNPCWKCSDRCVGCHCSCAAYKTWREGYDTIHDVEREEARQM